MSVTACIRDICTQVMMMMTTITMTTTTIINVCRQVKSVCPHVTCGGFRPPDRRDVHGPRHVSPILAVIGNPRTSPWWQPHYSDNTAGWKYFYNVSSYVIMCAVFQWTQGGGGGGSVNSWATGWVIFHQLTNLQAKDGAEEPVTTVTSHCSFGS